MLALRAVTRLCLTTLVRSRSLLALGALVLLLGWFDLANRTDASTRLWWSTWLFVAALAGFLVNYDIFGKLRADRSLRFLLLSPVRRIVLGAGYLTGGSIVSVAAVSLFLAYLLVTGGVPGSAGWAAAGALVGLGSIGFVAYAQALSLILPRDTAAVVGFLALIFGSGPAGRWLPAGTPPVVENVLQVFWAAMPTTERLAWLVAGQDVWQNTAVVVLQIGLGLLTTTWLLSRRALLVNRGQE